MDITSSNVKRNNFKWSKFFSIIAVVVLILVLVCLSYIQFRAYPRYITSFKDKYKYTFSLPNDELINKLYEQTFLGQELEDRVITRISSLDNEYYTIWDYKYEESRKEADVNNSYIVLDTIHSFNEINKDSIYFFFDQWQGYHFSDGKEALEIYDRFIERTHSEKVLENHNCMLLCSKYDLKKRIEMDSELHNLMLSIPASSYDVAEKAFSFFAGKRTVIANYIQFCLEHCKSNDSKLVFLKNQLQIYIGLEDDDKIEETAMTLLNLDANNDDAFYALGLINVNRENWKDAIRYSQLAIDLANKESIGLADAHLVMAWALYNTGKIEEAHDHYNKGYTSYSVLAKKYKAASGCPFRIKEIELSFKDSNLNIITGYGKKLYSKNSMYIVPRLQIYAFRQFRDEKVLYKLYEADGSLSRSNDSPYGYTNETDCSSYYTNEKGFDFEIELSGWGTPIKGCWNSGLYRIEIWYDGEMIGRKSFTIY